MLTGLRADGREIKGQYLRAASRAVKRPVREEPHLRVAALLTGVLAAHFGQGSYHLQLSQEATTQRCVTPATACSGSTEDIHLAQFAKRAYDTVRSGDGSAVRTLCSRFHFGPPLWIGSFSSPSEQGH